MSQPEDQKSGLGLPRDTLAAKLRPYMPLLDQEARSGVRHQRIIEYLESQGITISLKTFRLYLYRYRRQSKELEKAGSNRGAEEKKPDVKEPQEKRYPKQGNDPIADINKEANISEDQVAERTDYYEQIHKSRKKQT